MGDPERYDSARDRYAFRRAIFQCLLCALFSTMLLLRCLLGPYPLILSNAFGKLTDQLGMQFMDADEANKHFSSEEIMDLPDLWFNAARSVSPSVSLLKT